MLDPNEVRRKLEEDGDTLLVCAYSDDEKCGSMMIEGAMTFSEFEAKRDSLDEDREIAFYCG